jgi:hypothetical protein
VSSVNDGRILDADMGVVDTYYEQDGKFIINSVQDVEAIVEANKAAYNGVDERARFGKETFNRVANIPNVVIEDLMQKGIWGDKKKLLRWLDDRDNLAFRTRPGRLSR